MLFGADIVDDIAVIEVVSMQDESWCTMRVLVGRLSADGAVQILRVHTPKRAATGRRMRPGRDESLLPAARAAMEGAKR